ncbi:hypothetical protein CU633_09980 [Bacillus sp. V3-13]|uniref:hypothetical protein n=1 Tax=Bacillus sp. V3-13 TaxID=2053728 RepID=UPI000C780607|nr:hypothetical protein [Bacillus sp. V3-13]PLR77519.1 hypothetical protein CU633_09980 [Bacillus sp. V3-13]
MAYVIFDCTQFLTFNMKGKVDIENILQIFNKLDFSFQIGDIEYKKRQYLKKWIKSTLVELKNDEFIGEFEEWKEKDNIPVPIIEFANCIQGIAEDERVDNLTLILVHYVYEQEENNKLFEITINPSKIIEGLYHASVFGNSGNIVILNIEN